MIDSFIEYCIENPILTVLLIGLAIFILVLVILTLRLKSKANRAKQQTEKEIPATDTNTTAAPSTVAAEERIKKEKEEIQPVKKEEKIEKTEKKAEPKKAAATPIKKQTKTKTTTTNKRSKEKEMLLDEWKDINDEGIDFYEEDETDKIARYAGRWTICRIITKENTNPEEETFFFELHASNGEKLLASEEYTTYNGALRGIETHKANILKGNFRISLTKKGEYVFKLCSGKNLLLCMGEMYATKARCESAIESAKRFAKTAVIDENIQDLIVKLPEEDENEILPLPDGYNGKWIIKSAPDINGETVYYFELFASNGERLLTSEEYTTYIGAVNGIQTHRSNIDEGNFRVTLTKRGDYIYKLLNKNGQLLCLGEHYKTKRRCLNAVESVKRFAKNASVLTDSSNTK